MSKKEKIELAKKCIRNDLKNNDQEKLQIH